MKMMLGFPHLGNGSGTHARCVELIVTTRIT